MKKKSIFDTGLALFVDVEPVDTNGPMSCYFKTSPIKILIVQKNYNG
jgi:hypothetical protein